MTLRAWGLASNDEAAHPQEQCTTPQEILGSSGSTEWARMQCNARKVTGPAGNITICPHHRHT